MWIETCLILQASQEQERLRRLEEETREAMDEALRKRVEPKLAATPDIEVMSTDERVQKITVADGYMRIEHTYFYRPKWWQFWKAPSVTKKAWYTTLLRDGTASFNNWCTEDGGGVDTETHLWLGAIADAYAGRLRAKKIAEKLRTVDAKMQSPEIAELDPSSPTYNPLKKLRKEKVSE